MPFKHQTTCYRTRKGVRFENEGDICDATFGALHIQAEARVQELREHGFQAFSERHPDGFYRVFVAHKKEAA